HRARQQAIRWEFHWPWILAALLATWAMYCVLIWGWRQVVVGWREHLGGLDAARIWAISNLGKYIPGKVWAIAGMGMMAQRQGVSATAAMGSAVIMQLVALATGAMIALALVGTEVLDRLLGNWGAIGALALAVIALLAAISLASPALTARIAYILRRPEGIRPVEPGALTAGLAANFTSWCGYGLSLQLLARGTLHDVSLSWSTATGSFAASYIVGYLALLLPGGLGVREILLADLLKGSIGIGPAAALAIASRVATTLNDLGAALFLLPFRSKSRDLSRAT
ncbi:MAG: lysylphosphatidylglycerol synthase domain-containing protein, partial [Gemmatimonadales bacterium]